MPSGYALFTMLRPTLFRPISNCGIVNGWMRWERPRGPAFACGGRMGRLRQGFTLVLKAGVTGTCCLVLAQCSQAPGKFDPKYGVSSSPRLVALGEPVPKGGGTYRVGKPYTIGGRTYEPQENAANYTAEGLASWYGEDFHGRATANGEVYDMASISAAHPTLPIPSYARVTNLANQKSIIVRVNDRGPYHADRLIDVSVRTARLLGFYDRGVTRVRVEYVGRAALEGSDDTKLAATLRSGTPAPGPSEVRIASSRPFLPQRRSRCAAPCRCRPTVRSNSATTRRPPALPSGSRRARRGHQPSADRSCRRPAKND